MRLEPTLVLTELFRDIHVVHRKVLLFRLRCLSHRLMCFGFERHVNEYSPRERVLLGTIMAQQQHDALVKDAYKHGDTGLKQWLSERLPHLMAEAA